MDRKKKHDRPRLRKEDISTPVNFVHVQHVGFGPNKNHKSISGSFSACTSPTLQNDQFFDPNHRLSDSSLCGQPQKPPSSPGKENRFSHSYGAPQRRPNQMPPLPPPHSSMSNLSLSSQRDSLGSLNFSSIQINKQQPLKTSFSGSLLNLSFLNFGKSGSDKSKNSSSTTKSKRMSLGPQMSSTPLFTVPSSPPPPALPLSPPPPLASRNFVRRRSSSFAGEADFHFNPQNSSDSNESRRSKLGNMHDGHDGTNSTFSAWIKKPKITRNPSQLSPPLSPTYDELPPPPFELRVSSCPDPSAFPESPTYDELLPPPPSPVVVRRKNSASSSGGVTGDTNQTWIAPDKPLPAPPPRTPTRQLSSETPPQVELQIPETRRLSKLPSWRSKVVRVNAPTLPPLSVPLLRSSDGTLPTPPSWPLEPGSSPDFSFESECTEEGGQYIETYLPPTPCTEMIQEESELPEPPMPSSEPLAFPMQGIASKVKKVELEHLDPLSRLFQSRTVYRDWPVVMNELLSNMAKPESDGGSGKKSENPKVSKIYGELVTKTLELWLELGGGKGTFDDVISAFEHAQNKISNENKDPPSK